MATISWRVFRAGTPPMPIVDFPLTHPVGRLPLTRHNAPLYARSIAETFFAGPAGRDAWETLFGDAGDVIILIEITAPSEMAGRYEISLGRRISVSHA
jgi:hypothetical protein